MLLQALCIISKPLVNSNWSYSPEIPNLGQIRRFLEPCDLEIWRMTLKNNRAPLLSIIKLYASSHHHVWIQTGVTVRKRLSWVVTSVTLTFDLWPWPFAWTSLLSLVITPENFMMIGWWEHSQKGVTDRRTDRRTDGRTEPFIELLGRSYMHHFIAIDEFRFEWQSGNAKIGSNLMGTSPKHYQAICIISSSYVNSNWSYSPQTPNLGQNRLFFELCDLEIWQMTFENNRAPLLCYFKLGASFRSHWWIQTGVTVRKHPIWVKIDYFF